MIHPELDPELTSEWLMCRYRQHGCLWSVRFGAGQTDAARQARETHELRCRYRFHR
jgi:hypothetical protein